MNLIKLSIKKLNKEAIIPKYAKENDSGMDLYTLEDTVIEAHDTKVVKTGIAIQLQEGLEAQIRPRSGISLNGCKGCKYIESNNEVTPTQLAYAVKHSNPYLRVQLGTIDCSYTGDIGIITYNQEDNNVLIPKGTRLAQMVIAPVSNVEFIEVDKLEVTNRGESGFGSSGIN